MGTTPVPINTTPAPTTYLSCEKKLITQFIPTGESVIIASPGYPLPYTKKNRCGWKLKAPRKGLLSIECEVFDLTGMDKFKVNKVNYMGMAGPKGFMAKKLKMRFLANRKSMGGPGFKCTIMSIMM